MDRLIFTTMAGLEAVAAAELREHGLAAAAAGRGVLEARVEPAGTPGRVRRLNRALRCVQRVGVRIGRGRVGGLDEIREWARSLPFRELFEPPATFAVRAERYGRHDFQRPEIERAVGGAVQASFEASGLSPPSVDLTDPDALVRVQLEDEQIVVWLDTTGYRGLHVRRYRRYAHMASMRPTVANLLLRLGGWAGEGTLLDPFCGSGTIPIEAATIARGIDAGRLRGEPWAWERLEVFAAAGAADSASTARPVVPGAAGVAPDFRIVGIERFSGHLQGGAENAALAGMVDDLTLVPTKAQDCDRILAGFGGDEPGPQPLRVVTNPPFGRRVGFRSETRNLYRATAGAWRRAGAERIALLAENATLMQEALEEAGFAIEERLPAAYGAIDVVAFLAGRG